LIIVRYTNTLTYLVTCYIYRADPGICVRGASHLPSPPLKPARGSGECCKLPQWGPGGAPAEKEFGAL